MAELAPLGRDDDRPTLIGYSGGLDSTVLLHACAMSPLRARGLRAIHVHHGLHADADAWADHCARTCAALDVPLSIVRVAVDRRSGDGLEAAARSARYHAFDAALADDEVLALAQHRDDQAETFLLRALRGSGPDGLAAMRPWRRFGRGWLWRPLLDRPREALRRHASAHALQWIEDPGNEALQHDRNFLRHRVMPLLRERWPHAGASLARSTALCAEAAELLDEDDAGALVALRIDGSDDLAVGALLQVPVARRARVLRTWIASMGLPALPAQGIVRIESDLLPARADRSPVFAWHGAEVRRWRGRLHARRIRAPLPADWRVDWSGAVPLALPGGGTLRLLGACGFEQPIQAHARQGGERIRLQGRQHSHSLKHLLQAHAVPPWQRERMPLLSSTTGELLAAGDTLLSASMQAWLVAHGATLQWRSENSLSPV